VQSVLLRRRSKFERSVAMRWYTRHQAALMGREERAYTPRVALNVMVSEEDSALLRSIAPDAPCVVVPNGVDVDEYAPTDEEGDSIAFVGGTTWFPNLDALDYFCADILPRLRRLGVRAPVRWIGSASVDQQRSYRERYGVQLTGYLDDARPAMREAFCHVVPLRAGGGTRLKILNAWALGKPVVSTSVGCEGLRAVDGENILIRDDADGFARAIADLQSDLGLRAKLRAGARQTVDSHFAWDVIGRGMTRAYLRLIDRSETTERSRP
jgi:glycosyltransferase involved in cell wall biosynthesis